MSRYTKNGHLIKNIDDGVPNGNLRGLKKGDNTPNTRRKQGKGRKQNTLKLMAINVRGIKSKIMSLSAALNPLRSGGGGGGFKSPPPSDFLLSRI